MKCSEVKKLMPYYIDNELNGQSLIEFEIHVKKCKECKNELNSLINIINSTADLNEIEIPKNFHNELMGKINNIEIDKVQKTNIFKKYFKIKWLAPVTICLILLLVISNGTVVNYYKSYNKLEESQSIAFKSEIQRNTKEEKSVSQTVQFSGEKKKFRSKTINNNDNKISVLNENSTINKISQEELVNIYILVLKQLFNNDKILNTDMKFLALNINSMIGINSKENKNKILKSFSNINLKVEDASLDDLKKQKLFNEKTKSIEGVLLQFNNVKFVNRNEVIIEGLKFKSDKQLVNAQIVVKKQNNVWKITTSKVID